MPRKETINPPERKLPKRLPPHAARFVFPFYLAKEDGKESAVPGMHLMHLAVILNTASLLGNPEYVEHSVDEITEIARSAADATFDMFDRLDPHLTQHE